MSNIETLKSYLPKHFADLREVTEIFRAEGSEILKVNETIDDILDQQFIETATWGPRRYERLMKISSSVDDDYEIRRARIMAKRLIRPPMTLPLLTEIVNSYLRDKTGEVTRKHKAYALNIIIPDEGIISLLDLVKAIEDLKPAHFGARYYFKNEKGLSRLGFERGRVNILPIGPFPTGIHHNTSSLGTRSSVGVLASSLRKSGSFVYFSAGHLYAGGRRDSSNSGDTKILSAGISAISNMYVVQFPTGEMTCGVYPNISSEGSKSIISIGVSVKNPAGESKFPFVSPTSYVGTHPDKRTSGSNQSSSVEVTGTSKTGIGRSFPAGVYHCGEVI